MILPNVGTGDDPGNVQVLWHIGAVSAVVAAVVTLQQYRAIFRQFSQQFPHHSIHQRHLRQIFGRHPAVGMADFIQ